MKYRWEMLLWLWLAFLFHQADRQAFSIVLPLLKSSLSLSDVQLGLVNSVFALTTGIMVPFAGYWGDRFSRKSIIVLSLGAWSIATFVTGFGAGIIFLVAVRGIATAVGESFFAPSAIAMISMEHRESRARALSIFQTAVYIGLMLSGWIGSLLATHFGWRTIFWVFGAIGMVLSVLLQFRIKPATSSALARTSIGPALRTILAIRTVPYVMLPCAAMIFVNTGYLAWAPSYLYERFHLTLVQAAVASMVFHQVGALSGVLAGGWLSDALARLRPQARLELQAMALLAGAPFLYLVGSASTRTLVFIALSGFGFFRGIYDANTYPAYYSVVPLRYHSTASGLLICFSFIVGSGAPVLLGKAKETIGLSHAFSALSLIYAAGAAIAAWGATSYFLADHRKLVEEAI